MKRHSFLILAALLCFSILPAMMQAKDYKAVSFNIRLNNSSDGDNAWPNRKQACVDFIKKERPDFFGIQEALPGQYDWFKQKLSRRYGFVGVGRDDGKNEGEAMAVFFNKRRFRLLESHTYWLSETPERVSKGWDAACRRTVTFVHLKDKRNGKQICYFNTHLDHVGKVARRESVLLLCDLIKKHVPEGMAVVLGGDLNSGVDSEIFEPFGEIGLLASREVSPVTDYLGTYNGWGKADSVIDHFFIRDVKPLTFRCVRDNYGVPFISDHYPICMTFAIR